MDVKTFLNNFAYDSILCYISSLGIKIFKYYSMESELSGLN